MPDAFDALPKHYDPQAAEKAYGNWEKKQYFSSAPQSDRPNYSILLPPPNVTGTLHMGHAFQHTLMDSLIRYRRMLQHNTLWQSGTDHAGIATQIVVTRELERRGIKVKDLNRDEFLTHAWEWKKQSGSTITQQMRRLGASCDWTRERFTMDKGLSAAVTEAFVRLYEDGLIYRGKRLVNWDPVLLTAISDLEIVSEEESGMMYYVRYPFVDNPADGIIIGTTRPETILVDGAIAVHPDDARFQPLLGKRVHVPLTEPLRDIEIIADKHVDPDFGSGCVKITAAHDFNDYEIYLRHSDKNIPVIVLLTLDAKMNENAPQRYQGMDRFDARQHIVGDLAKAGLLVDQKPHTYKLPRGDRSGVVVEPMLTDQWFVRMEELAKRGLATARTGKVRFIPGNWRKVYDQWLENIHDWCISRQLMWGHQIPAWYDDDGNLYVARSEEEAKRQAGSKPLRRDDDVLDTWFSSALWPFSTLDWPQTDNPHFAAYFPTSVLVTGFDILFFWVARMVMMSDYFIGDTPFSDVYITGLVRDSEGQKMSKSRGNVLDPLDLIDGISAGDLVAKRTQGLMNPKQAATIADKTKKEYPNGIPAYGVDALRFTFASLASYGRDIKFDLSRCEGYRHFCNKLWNAGRFVLGVVDSNDTGSDGDGALFTADDWITDRLQLAIATVTREFAAYRFDLAAQAMYQFFWHDYCDWYLEVAKIQLRLGDDAVRRRTRQTLLSVLETGLRLCHPIIPFITEQLWQKISPRAEMATADTIMQAPYPQVTNAVANPQTKATMQTLMDAISAVRKLRSEHGNFSLFINGDNAGRLAPFIAKLGGVPTTIGNAPSAANTMQQITVDGLQLTANIAADDDATRKRWQTQLDKITAQLQTARQSLENPQFTERAPAAVVEKKKRLIVELTTEENKLKELLKRS